MKQKTLSIVSGGLAKLGHETVEVGIILPDPSGDVAHIFKKRYPFEDWVSVDRLRPFKGGK